MPRTITVQDESVILELDKAQADILDRALTGFTKALVAARDMSIISHETLCADADKAREVQYLLWACKDSFAKQPSLTHTEP